MGTTVEYLIKYHFPGKAQDNSTACLTVINGPKKIIMNINTSISANKKALVYGFLG